MICPNTHNSQLKPRFHHLEDSNHHLIRLKQTVFAAQLACAGFFWTPSPDFRA